MVSTVIIILTFVFAVYGHGCKDFKLSASDQSVIDMMKHYLHTSRKTECSDRKLSNTFYFVSWSKTKSILLQIIFKHIQYIPCVLGR